MLGGFRVAGKTIRTVGTTVGTTSVDEPAPFAIAAVAPPRAAAIVAGLARFARLIPWAVCAIVAIAAALRFAELDDVGANQFYDAAVRSMSLSWHNFFFGAFDPGVLLFRNRNTNPPAQLSILPHYPVRHSVPTRLRRPLGGVMIRP